ncbi:hypothetical protein L0668_09635 [Paraglaciecola aquimarina]|uniref:HEAT repeat domain-containing protein n=1 Tax=Paraglaciecola algarum TaxID=3050085 RepID=A0ABS9D8Q4_9ALTE|nr:hypothetical protein [Paraglaciecola sp. G1-23]MCF2948367.1 hypothetical protein [Paraglaciecola sp. G1-23]
MKYIIGLLWGGSLLAAFYVGYKWQQNPVINSSAFVQQEPSESSLEANPNPNKVVTTKFAQSSFLNINTNHDTHSQLSSNDILLQVKELLDNGSGMNMAELAQAYNLLLQLNPEQLLQALSDIDTKVLDEESSKLFSLLLSRYAEFEPQSAMAFVEHQVLSNKAQTAGRTTVLSTWADSDPLAALDWFNLNVNSQSIKLNGVLIEIFAGIAKQDVNLAIDNLSPFLRDRRALSLAVSGLAKSLSTSEDFVHVLDKTKDMDNKDLTQNIVRAWTSKAPEDVLQWVSTIEDKAEQNKLEESVYRTWLYTDADKAAEMYMNTAGSANRQKRASFVAKSLSFTSPEKALSWVQEQVDVDTNTLMKNVVKSSTYRQPEFAANNLDLFTDKKEYLAISMRVYSSYQKVSQTQADNFLNSAKYKNELETKISELKKRMEKYRKNN